MRQSEFKSTRIESRHPALLGLMTFFPFLFSFVLSPSFSSLFLPPLFSSRPFRLLGAAASLVAVLLAVKSAFNVDTKAACGADLLYSNGGGRHYQALSSSP